MTEFGLLDLCDRVFLDNPIGPWGSAAATGLCDRPQGTIQQRLRMDMIHDEARY
jgi:hypothetical protein